MDAFEALIRQAEQRRDAVCVEARRECREIIQWVKQLRRRLDEPVAKKPAGKYRHVHELIYAVLPKDREFTVAQVLKLVREVEPQRKFTMASMRAHLQYLEVTGKVRRMRRTGGNVFWAAAGFDAAPAAHGVRTLVSMAQDILSESGPLAITDLLVAIRERGYRADADPRRMMSSLSATLSKNKRFRREGRKWAV